MVNSKGETPKTSILRKLLEVNVIGTFNVTKYAAWAMINQEG